MNVWLMNLRDNRDEPNANLGMSKFEFCKSNGILGIGWVGYDAGSDDTAFSTAKKYIDSFEAGDLVWTKDPVEHTYYLCEILATAEAAEEEFHKHDISRFCECEFIEIGQAEDLPEGITSEDLISRHTISRANQLISEVTERYCNNQCISEQEFTIKGVALKVGGFIKKHKLIFAIALAAIVALSAVALVVTGMKENKVREFLEGKIFIKYTDSWTYVYAFDNGLCAEETWYSNGDISGDITSYDEYRVVASLFSDTIWIEVKRHYGSWYGWGRRVAVSLEPSGEVVTYKHTSGTPDWHEITLEEVNAQRTYYTCDHEFRETVIREATCSKVGETKRTCVNCGSEEIITTSKEHEYSYGVCIECGSEKPRESADIEADAWYVYNPLDVLKIQNCVVVNATKIGDAISVAYYPVCSKCHVMDEWMQVHSPELDYPISKMYECDACGNITVVRLEIRP